MASTVLLGLLLAVVSATVVWAVPTPAHRALQVDPAIATVLNQATRQYDMELVTEMMTQLSQNRESGSNELWFHSFDESVPSVQRCGEINAAPYMPAALFEPRNFLKLLAYTEVTVRLYRTPVLNTPVAFGRCSTSGYDVCAGGVQGVGWTPAGIMGPVCGERCGCNFQGACNPAGNFPGFPSCSRLPSCRNVPDDSAAGEFCSLCSPATACPGCNRDTVSIRLCYQPSPPPPPAPQPPAAQELYFYYINVAQDRCGDVNAAPLMPAALFQPSNALELAAYVEATTRFYSITPYALSGGPPVTVRQGRCADHGYTVAGTAVPAKRTRTSYTPAVIGNGKSATAVASWTPSSLMTPVCEQQCHCKWPTPGNAYAPNRPGDLRLCGGSGHGTQSRPDEIDNPPDAPGSFCSLCGAAACPINPEGCGQQIYGAGDGVNINLFYRPSSFPAGGH